MPTALVIDDAKVVRLLLESHLTDLGWTVLQAAHGREALEVLRASPSVSLALVDWNMPVMNGLEFVKAVRAESSWSELTLVMVTSENDVTQIVKALDAGATDYIMKPFTDEVIAQKLLLLGLIEGQSV